MSVVLSIRCNHTGFISKKSFSTKEEAEKVKKENEDVPDYYIEVEGYNET